MSDKELVLAVQPNAKHLTDAGECDDCGWGHLFFFTLEEEPTIVLDGYVSGGFYCVDCGFGNAGAYPAELVAGVDL